MKLLTICLCLSLTACCPDVVIKKAPIFDARLMEPCVSLGEAKIASFNDVLEAKAADVRAYTKCKNAHTGLIDSVKAYQEEFNK